MGKKQRSKMYACWLLNQCVSSQCIFSTKFKVMSSIIHNVKQRLNVTQRNKHCTAHQTKLKYTKSIAVKLEIN